MGRWIAIGKVSGWECLERLTMEMKATSQWRIDPKVTITSVYVLGDGRLIAECHAPSQTDFNEWLNKKGWTVESIAPIIAIAKTGEVWKV